ncbi:MAG: hypothetical protein Q7T14_08315 [Aestuariivirga sp.]|nr:hypothetical protein [Aestuariivirga sp.]
MIRRLQIAGTFSVALGIACAFYSGQATASTIVAPIGAEATTTFNSPSGNDYSILHTIDQSGLSAEYISGETDFDDFLAGNPTHTSLANGNEWFSRDYYGRRSVASQTITYAFSALTSINGFALWNEEFAGIGTTQLWWSADDEEYTLLDTIVPVDSAFGSLNYLAQIFEFDPIDMLFFRLVITDCPGPPRLASRYRGCGIGEIAFSAELGPVDNNPIVPLPAALPLLASALGLFVWMGQRRKSHN